MTRKEKEDAEWCRRFGHAGGRSLDPRYCSKCKKLIDEHDERGQKEEKR